jgi:prephenate dehydrogenase
VKQPGAKKQFERAVIVGVGLLGGSIGMALRERKLAKMVVGVSRKQSNLAAAIERGAIDMSSPSLEEACQGADLAIICTPVQTVAAHVVRCAQQMPNGGLITDVGSTKQNIVEAVAQTSAIAAFVGSHPLAGSEKSGVEYAKEDLLENRLVVVTPGLEPARLNQGQLDLAVRAESLWHALGARTMRMSPSEHDHAVARTSHLPHLLASALAGATPETVLPLAASGWCDTTRVASGGAELWRQIFEDNRTPIVSALEEFSAILQQWLDALRNGDSNRLTELLIEGKQKRDSLGN